MNMRNILTLSLLALLSEPNAEARLGEDFGAFLQRFTKTTKSLKPLAQLPGVSTQHFTFEVNVPVDQKKASPGFAAGVTVTVTEGKIVGQSLAVKPGNNVMVGQKLAGIHGFSFAYEAIGKTIPPTRDKAEVEFKAFCDAVDRACMGEQQYLRYPGFKAVIAIRTDSTSGNILIAATPDMPTQPPPLTR
ncbi:MAG: hypothetical protein K2X29_04875 [Candidatus Obscuribacterales bacterium]|nr:hypothetical protein [Candidatus Obscuribacterales bacterium]